MMRSPGVVRVLVAVLVLATVAFVTVFAGAAANDRVGTSAYDDGPDGASELGAHLQARGLDITNVAVDLRVLNEAANPRGMLFIMPGVSDKPSDEEVDHLDAFVARGGRVIVADDSGFGTLLGQRHGVTFGRAPVRDTAYVDDAALIHVDLRLGGVHTELLTNGPTVLFIDNDARGSVIGNSRPTSFLDLDRDDTLDPEDQYGPFPIAYQSVPNNQGGRYVFIADADLFGNAVMGASENRRGVDGLIDYLLPRGGTIVFDERGRETNTVLAGAARMASVASAAVGNPLVALAAAPLVFIGVRRALRAAPEPMPPDHRFCPDADATPPEAAEALRRAARGSGTTEAASTNGTPPTGNHAARPAAPRPSRPPRRTGESPAPPQPSNARPRPSRSRKDRSK